MGLNDKNLASGVLASSVASSATTLSVNCGTGSSSTLTGVWPSVPFYITVMPASPSAGVANSLDSEIMQVTAITSNGATVTMTVSRGKKGTTAKSFGEGSIVTNSIYTRAGRYTAATSSADGASTMVYTITSDELPNEPSDGDILLVQFPKQADNSATLKVNNGSFDIIYCQSIDGAQLSAIRQENPTSTVEPLLFTDRWYILIYHYDENYSSGGWLLQNTFLPVSSVTPGDKVVMRAGSDPATISTTRVSIVSTTVDSDGDYLAIGSVAAGTGSTDSLYSYAFIDNGTDNTTYATNISTITSGRICMTVMGKITGLHQGDTVRLSAQTQGSSYSTSSRDQSLALIKLNGPSARPMDGITPDYSALQTDIGDLSTAYTVQNPCYLRVEFVAYGSSASSGYVSLVINGQEAQRAYAILSGSYYIAQMSGIVPVTTGDQIQVTKTSDLTWGAARKAYIIPAKGNGWPNYNSEEF